MDRFVEVQYDTNPTILFYRAMAHHRLGRSTEARTAFDQARRWMNDHGFNDPIANSALAEIRAEAEAVLAGPPGELPEDVFAPVR